MSEKSLRTAPRFDTSELIASNDDDVAADGGRMMKSSKRLFLGAALAVAFVASTTNAQLREERRPDVSDKALITKEGPTTEKDRAGKAKAGRAVKQSTIEQFMATTKVGGSSFTHDEQAILFHSNKSGIFNVYSIPVGGGEPKQLTNSTKESTYVVSAFPNDARFLYTCDRGGNENSHLYLRELDGSERDLTPGENTKANFLGWARDRKSFFFSTNARDLKFFDIFEMSIADLRPVLLYQDDTGYDFGDISDDKRFITFQKKAATTADSDVHLVNLETKEMKNITEHTGVVRNEPQAFDPDSRYLYFHSDEGGEFKNVERYELATGKREVVEQTSWDAAVTSFSRNGKYRVLATNEDARTRVKIYDHATGKPIELPKLPDGDITGVNISDSEERMAFYHHGSRSPDNLFVYDFTKKSVKKLTQSVNAADRSH